MSFYQTAQVLNSEFDGFSEQVGSGGKNTTPVAANTTTDTVIKGSAGRIGKVLVTATGTAALNIYDNATTHSGTVLCAIPASAAVGTVYDVQFPAANGITVGGIANSPGITIGWD